MFLRLGGQTQVRERILNRMMDNGSAWYPNDIFGVSYLMPMFGKIDSKVMAGQWGITELACSGFMR